MKPPTSHPPEGFAFVDGSVLGELAWLDCGECWGNGVVWIRTVGRADLVRCERCRTEILRRVSSGEWSLTSLNHLLGG